MVTIVFWIQVSNGGSFPFRTFPNAISAYDMILENRGLVYEGIV
jgi:hypothetical protein